MKESIGMKKYIEVSVIEKHSFEAIAYKFGIQPSRELIAYDLNYHRHYTLLTDSPKHVYLLSGHGCENKEYGYYVKIFHGGYFYSILHRIGAPAEIFNGDCAFYIDGYQYLNTKEYCEACKFSKVKTMEWYIKYGELLPTLIDDLL